MEYKNFVFEIKEVSEEGVFEGYASTFNNIDFGNDKILPGAFTKTLKKNKGVFPILADHNLRDQIGWNLEAIEDSKGLKIKGKLDFNVQKAVEKHSLAKMAKDIKGAKMGLSIGYSCKKHEWDGDVRLLKELELYETSFTAMPMNEKATVTSVKEARPCSSRDGDSCSIEEGCPDTCSMAAKGFCASKKGCLEAGLKFNVEDIIAAINDAKERNVQIDLTSYIETEPSILVIEALKAVKDTMTVKEFEATLRDSGVSRSKAVTIASLFFNESRSDSDQIKELMDSIDRAGAHLRA